ncbi:hypothetical protein ACE1B6_00365 [Aerosakkonemataceae cyanobacterium BLCC-F154]|uniref:DUF975 domain-containing protein n=1 Tax=Floridaenema fluviatile BLCC-F154 TaxID=3153640 RepID=A0ABV4Y4J1_9CYAN
MAQSSIRPLSVGNVVSSAFVLYRSHFKLYLGLAFKSLLWSLIPIYGWAKAAMISAQISRLGFGDLINQPETAKSAENHLKPRMWTFLGAAILVGLVLFAINFGLSIVSNILQFAVTGILGNNNSLAVLLGLVIILVTWFVQLWFQARYFIPELPIAIENVDATTTISRTWELTKGAGVRIQIILLVAYLISAPLIFIASIPLFFLMGYLVALGIQAGTSSAASDAGGVLIGLIFAFIVLVVLMGTLIMPFWQAVKAVIYYDLRSRREGMGLQVRDRNFEV